MTTIIRTTAILGLGVQLLAAQTPANRPPGPAAATPPLSPIEQTIKDVKNPAPWFSWGLDFRVRNEYMNNLLTLSASNPLHEQDYFRFRSRIWLSITPVQDLSFNARLASEARDWLKPAGFTPFSPEQGMDWRNGVIDNLNVQWKNILQQPLSVIVGRQDILLGDGWLTGDGTPFDGSWTYFLDAARVTYEHKDSHTTIDAIGIAQSALDDEWLETVNANQHNYQTEQNEKGAILYVANSSLKSANLAGYFIYKHDDAANDIAPRFRPDNANIFTFGARVSGIVSDHWKYSAEGAYQFGEKQDPSIAFPSRSLEYRDLAAYGFNSKLGYLFKDRLNNQLGLAYEFLSGDDPDTQDDEMFDNLWGRWPRWSEIGLYSYAAETRIGNAANLHRIGPSWSITPIKNLDFSASYYALFAQHEVATRAPQVLFSGTDRFRGHFFQAVLKYKFSRHVSGHLWGEVQLPGDYYVNDKLMSFLRAEVLFTF